MKRTLAIGLAAIGLLAPACADAATPTPRQQAAAMRDCLRAHDWTARSGARNLAAHPPRHPHAFYRATFPTGTAFSGPVVVWAGLNRAERRTVRGCR